MKNIGFRADRALLLIVLVAGAALQCAYADTATVIVNAKRSEAKVPAAGYGMNTAVFDNDLIDSSLPGLMSADGITALRFPGGSYSDAYHWANNSSTPYNPSFADSADTNIYINANDTFQNWMKTVALPLRAHPIITVNYGSNASGTGGGDPSEAAAWVKFANVTNKYNITYWEIGNEVGGNGYYGDPGWELDLHYPYYFGARAGQSELSPATYGQNALAYISAMKAVDPNIKIGVGISQPGTYPDTANPSYNQQLLSQCGTKIDFVIIHWYPGGSASQALGYPSTIPSIIAATRNELNEYCGSNAANIQILVTETNDVTTDQMDCSMFAGDDYLSWFEQGVRNVDWWNLHQTYLSNGVSGVPNNTPDATYWGIKMASLTARPGDSLVPSSSNNSLLRVHATHRSDGSVGILLMNEDPNNSDTVSVSVSGPFLSPDGVRYDFGPSHFSGSSQYSTDGPTESIIAGVGNSFTITVPAYTESLVIVPPGGNGFAVSANPLSVGIRQGVRGTCDISVDPSGGFTGDVSFTASGLPSGVTVSFAPAASAHSSVATFSANSAAAVGTTPVTITGTCSAVVSTATIALTVTPRSTLIENGKYTLVSLNSGMALDDPNFSIDPGADMDQSTIAGGANQTWILTNLGGNVVTLENTASGQMLDVAGASKTAGALVDQWPSNGQTNQEWTIGKAGSDGYYSLASVNSGQMLDVTGASKNSGALIDQWPATGNANQEWAFRAR